jgi:autotransporter-associated beta strand protein
MAITQRPIMIIADADQSKIYGNVDLVYSYSKELLGVNRGLIGTDAFSGTLSRVAGESIGDAYVIGQGNLANSNYAITYVEANFAVTARSITITATANSGQSKIYGNADPVLNYDVQAHSTNAGLVAGDVFTGALTRALGEDVGNHYLISQGTLANANYIIHYVGDYFAITPRPITISANAYQSKVYGNLDSVLAYSKEALGVDRGLIGSDGFSGSLARVDGEGVGNYAIGQGSLNSSNYNISYLPNDFAITPRPITLLASTATKIYGEVDAGLVVTVTSGSLGSATVSDTLTDVTGTLSRAAGEDVAHYNIQLGAGSKTANYTITYATDNAAFAITQRPIYVSADGSQAKVYGEADGSFSYTTQAKVTGAGLLGTDGISLTGSLARETGADVGRYSINQGTLAASSNYSIQYTAADYEITARPIIITARVGQTKIYGNVDEVFNYDVEAVTPNRGLVVGDALSGALTRMGGENVGNAYTIGLGTLAIGGNYVVNYVPTNYAITAKTLTITASAQSTIYGTAMDLGATNSVGVNRFNTSSLVAGDSITSVSLLFNANNHVSALTGAGTYTGGIAIADASGVGLTNYDIQYINGDLTVNKARLAVVADAKAITYGATVMPDLTASISGFVNAQDLASSGVIGMPALSTVASAYNGSAGSASVVGSYAITPSIGTLTSTNYDFDYGVGVLTVNKANLNVLAANDSKTYGATTTAAGISYVSGVASAATSGYTVSGLVNGDSVRAVTLSSTGANSLASIVGAPYSIIASDLLGSERATINNYNITFSNAEVGLAIGKARLTASGTQVYNGQIEFDAANLLVTGVFGETFAVTGSATMTTKNVQSNRNLANVNGLILSEQSNGLLSNYEVIGISDTQVSVTVRPIALTAPILNKVYNGGYTYDMTALDLTNMSTQLVGGDRVSSASVVFTGNNPNVGIDKQVSLSSVVINDGNSGGNYNVSLLDSNTSSITPAMLTVTAVNDAKLHTQADIVGFGGVIINGFANGEDASQLSGTLVITRSNSAQNNIGVYPGVLVASGYAASNYEMHYVNGSYAVLAPENLLVRVRATGVNYTGVANYLPNMTAQYLAIDDATISNYSVSGPVSGLYSAVGTGGSASFTVSPLTLVPSVNFSGSNNISVGGYNLEQSAASFTGTLIKGMTLVGSLNVAPKTLNVSDLDASTSMSKIYDGGTNISGAALNFDAATLSVMAGDRINLTATGTYDNKNVGTNKTIDINVALSGADARNYALSSTRVTGNFGTITQLPTVTWVGPQTGGRWSNASNWLNGALPDLGNVAQVIIPTAKNIIFDSALVGQVNSQIQNNGTITFSGANNFDFSNNVSGEGNISQSGSGTLTISGNNSFSGIVNINSSRLIVANNNAMGMATLVSSGGYFGVGLGVVIPNLNVNGAVYLTSDIYTLGTQTYNGAVTFMAGNAVSGVVSPMTISSQNASINFMSTLDAGLGSKTAMRSINISAIYGEVNFNGRVGDVPRYYLDYQNNLTNDRNIYQLNVRANTIAINADITTFETQTYDGAVLVGDNGTNGLTRLLLSIDPSIIFKGTIDDVLANTHTLIVKPVTIRRSDIPVATFEAAVGSIKALQSLVVEVGSQFLVDEALLGIIDPNPQNFVGTINLQANVTTSGDQSYTAKNIAVGNSSLENTVTLSTNSGEISFHLGTSSDAGFVAIGTEPTLGFKLGLLGSVNLETLNGLQTAGFKTSLIREVPVNVSGYDSYAGTLMNEMRKLKPLEEGESSVEVGEVTLVELCDKPKVMECPLI